MTAPIRVGTCSFADEALARSYYPRGVRTGPERLRHYAGRFDTVEVDSTYYTLPVADYAARWAAATPAGFVFHVKAFALMTRHPVRAVQLPPDLRASVEPDERGRVDRPPREVRAEVFARFRAALEPLREAGKLGGILVQFPPYVVPRRESYADIAWVREQLEGNRVLVELRHAAWLDEPERARLLAFLEDIGASYVAVDAPRTGGRNVLPTVVAATSPIAYVRMHGRNAATWNVRGGSAAERFDHLYAREELEEWVEPLRELGATCEEVFVLFNTNGRSPAPGGAEFTLRMPGEAKESEWIAQGPANAEMLRDLLREAGVPVSNPAAEISSL